MLSKDEKIAELQAELSRVNKELTEMNEQMRVDAKTKEETPKTPIPNQTKKIEGGQFNYPEKEMAKKETPIES